MCMKNALNFTVIITQDEDGVFVASVPAIPGCHSQGDTYEEATEHIKEAIRLCLNVAKDDKGYRDRINFDQSPTSRFIGISDVSIATPNFL
jgi:predicted RNase H-like HicB family nuclease